MGSIVAESALAGNLASLGELNRDLAEALERPGPEVDLEFADTPQGVPTAVLGDQRLASRHRPLDEADRLVESIDLLEHSVVVVLGFGLGYHVQRLAERLERAGLIIVFEPDVALLRAVLARVDHSRWLRKAAVVWITDPTDRGVLASKLQGAESILAQGVEFLEHPASRGRLAEPSKQFSAMFSEYVATAKTTLLTTLMRSVDTVRNLLLNLDHYSAGPGIADLENAARGRLAVVVSAGPSLRRNLHRLARPGVRDRCVIIAVQTTLKPLLEAGIKPHFVTALDYHEISRRFYEDLDPDDVRDVTLIADPKAHPVILDLYPGPVRCCASDFLDQLLGDLRREMGTLPAGATVAHLALYVARFLGCNPIAVIGQDLGFTDGLYYAPGTAIAEVWAPELSPFNTIEMMEWQRIVRHRLHLQKLVDVHGKSIFTDAQMVAYLHQFERDFAAYEGEGITIIDATEGGVAKQHTTAMPLVEVLDEHATVPLEPMPEPRRDRETQRQRLRAVGERLAEVRRNVAGLRGTSRKTAALIRRMLDDQADPAKMSRHFEKIVGYRKEVQERFEAFEILQHLNQLGVFKRLKADRRLHMERDLDPLVRQRRQLERDLENVTWIADAAQEMIDQLAASERLVAGGPVSDARPRPARQLIEVTGPRQTPRAPRIAALVPVDPDRNGLGVRRSLGATFAGRPVLQATLERLGRSRRLQSIVLIAPQGADLEAMIDRSRIGLPVHIERTPGSPYGPEHEAIAAARLWSDTSWRGGIAGMSIYDEVLCPEVMDRVMRQRELTAALLVGPDWPLVEVTSPGGCDAVVDRHCEHPQQLNLVFTQAPPGLCGCLLGASLMHELSQRNRLSTVGGLLVYQPHAPQHDPIARDANVQIDHRVRRSLVRATFDSPRRQRHLAEALDAASFDGDLGAAGVVAALERPGREPAEALPPQVILELSPRRQSRGIFARHPCGPIDRPPLRLDLAERIFDQLGEAGDVALTLGGVGDPLLHERFDELVEMARRAGVHGVHLRTELLADRSTLDRLLACGVDVVSVDLHADRAVTYERMMGFDRFREVLLNIEHLLADRRRLTPQAGSAALALPWIVPRLQRRAETHEDLDSFFDRWQRVLGTALIEGPPPFDPTPQDPGDTLIRAVTPPRVVRREAQRRMTIYCDGSVPVSELDLAGRDSVGNAAGQPLAQLWRTLMARRQRLSADAHLTCYP